MKDRYVIVFIFAIGLIFYSLTLKGILGNPQPQDIKNNLDQVTKPLELSPERGRFAAILALGEHRRYDLNRQLAEAVYPDVGVLGDKYFSFFAPGMAYLSLPFYLIGRHFGLSQTATFGFISLVSIIDLLLVYVLGRQIFRLPKWAGLFAVLVFAFATTSWSYATSLYQHMLTVFFMLSSFYAVWRYRQNTRYSWLWAAAVWLSYGLAISIDYPNAVLLLPVIIYFLIASVSMMRANGSIKVAFRPVFLLSMAAFIAVTALHGYHNQINFGGWRNLSGQLPQFQITNAQNAASQAGSDQATEQISAKKGLATYFYEANMPFGFYTLTVSMDRGLFVYSPIMLLALWGIYKLRKRVPVEIGILLSLAAVNLLLYSSWGDPWGGWAYGPRYLIPSMPILALLAAWGLTATRKRIAAKTAAFVLFAASSAVALLGVLTTNATPPKIEAVDLRSRYGFLFNWDFFRQGKSSSLLYNTYFSDRLSLQEYALIIYGALLLVALIVLFVLPRWESEKLSV